MSFRRRREWRPNAGLIQKRLNYYFAPDYRSIAYYNGKIFVGDQGKNRIFVLDDTRDVETVGETGNCRLQFKVSRFLRSSALLLFLKIKF